MYNNIIGANRTSRVSCFFALTASRLSRPVIKILFGAFLLAAISCSTWASAAERIQLFDSDITVSREGDIVVVEHIALEASGDTIRHGIYRDIVGVGHQRPEVKVESVQRDGRTEPYHVEHLDGSERIRIGSAATNLEPGPHTYEIRYVVVGQLLRDRNFDRLYWNVTGDQWALPIDAVHARVTVPTKSQADSIAYTGSYGLQGTDYTQEQVGPGEFAFASTSKLPPGSGLTVDVRWPHSVSTSLWSKLSFLSVRPELLVPCLALLVLIAWWVIAWFHEPQHVHPPKETIVSSPPQNLSPSALRYACEGFLDNKGFTSAVVDLAARGIIRIEEGDEDYRMTVTKREHHELPAEERELLKAMFGATHSVDLKRDSRRVLRALHSFAAAMNSKYGHFVAARPSTILGGWAISACAVGWSFASIVDGADSAFEMTLLLALLVACVALLRTSLQTFHRTRSLGDFAPRLGVLVPLGMTILTALILVGLSDALGWWWVAFVVLHIVVNLAGERWLRMTTGETAQIAAEAEQFREYLCDSAAGSMNESTFSRWAGYALALDVEDQWLAALDRDVDESLSSGPGWYHGDNFDEFYIRSSVFNRGLVRAAGIPYSHGPGGSGGGYGGGGSGGGGSFGGGFSGGGAGGGGGGGW